MDRTFFLQKNTPSRDIGLYRGNTPKGGSKMAKKQSAADFFKKHNRSFMKFGELFTKKITDEQLISSLAEKDLEKLAKVFRLVFEMVEENASGDSAESLARLIEAYSEVSADEQA